MDWQYYEQIEVIDTGGMATLHRALDVRHNRYVVLKRIQRRHLHKEEARGRFAREVEIMKLVSKHPNIPTLLESGEFPSNDGEFYQVPYYIMEYIDGGSALAHIEHRGRMDLATVRHIMQNILSATSFAHQLGIVHRDIKPSNILLSSIGEAYLADFGVATRPDGSKATQYTRLNGSFIGTYGYVAPEIQYYGQQSSVASDIYSLGRTLYELLYGVSMSEMMQRRVSRDIFWKNIPSAFAEVITKAVSDRPNARYASADLFSAALEQAYHQTDAAPNKMPPIPVEERSQVPDKPQATQESAPFANYTTINVIKRFQDSSNTAPIILGLTMIALVIIGALTFMMSNQSTILAPTVVTEAIATSINQASTSLSSTPRFATSTPFNQLDNATQPVSVIVTPTSLTPVIQPTSTLAPMAAGMVARVFPNRPGGQLIIELPIGQPISADEISLRLLVGSGNPALVLIEPPVQLTIVDNRAGFSRLSLDHVDTTFIDSTNADVIELTSPQLGEFFFSVEGGCLILEASDDDLLATCYTGRCNRHDGDGTAMVLPVGQTVRFQATNLIEFNPISSSQAARDNAWWLANQFDQTIPNCTSTFLGSLSTPIPTSTPFS